MSYLCSSFESKFILSHPIAGSEKSGFLNSSEDLFKDKISIIAEIKKASPSAGVIFDDYQPLEIANIYNDNIYC